MKNPFADRAKVLVRPDCFEVKHTHWTKRKLDVSVPWDQVSLMRASQEEPFVLVLEIITKAGDEIVITEKMDGWPDFLIAIGTMFPGFNWGAMEDAKGSINDPKLCWQRT
ncbi:MAG: hypothetical protein HY735_24705 [Verrucomicrobia bacterium]|nr:hypothetical protein [Verrucomicrobiota bacterium]